MKKRIPRDANDKYESFWNEVAPREKERERERRRLFERRENFSIRLERQRREPPRSLKTINQRGGSRFN